MRVCKLSAVFAERNNANIAVAVTVMGDCGNQLCGLNAYLVAVIILFDNNISDAADKIDCCVLTGNKVAERPDAILKLTARIAKPRLLSVLKRKWY